MILEGLAGAAVLCAGLVAHTLLRRRAPGRTRSGRFELRLRNPRRESVLLARQATGSDVVESAEITLVDDGENRIRLPAGLRLTLGELEVAEWTDVGEERHLLLLPNGPFWVVGAPRWARCAATDEPGVRALPRRDYTLTSRGPDPREADPTLGAMEFPIWDANLQARSWLLPARRAGATPIVVVAFVDPHGANDPERAHAVRGAAFVLADELARRTDAPVSSAPLVIVGHALAPVARAGPAWDVLSGLADRFEGPHLVVRGEALRDLSRGFRVSAHLSTAADALVVEGPLGRVADAIAEQHTVTGGCERTRAEHLDVPVEASLAYARVASLALESLLADDANQAIEHVPGRSGGAAAAARDLAAEYPEARVFQYLSASTAIRARDDDELPEDDWNRLLDRCDDPEDPLFALSPLLLHRLDFDGAKERRTELLTSLGRGYRSAPDPFSAWLIGLDLEPDDDE